MDSDGTASNFVIIRAARGNIVLVEKAVAMQSPTLKKMIEREDFYKGQLILEIPYISDGVFNKVFEYCEKHLYDGDHNSEEYKKEIMDFDKKFVDMEEYYVLKVMKGAESLRLHALTKLLHKQSLILRERITFKGQSSKNPIEVTEDDTSKGGSSKNPIEVPEDDPFKEGSSKNPIEISDDDSEPEDKSPDPKQQREI